MECIFCNIAAKKVKSSVIFETESVIAILDIRPVNFGHALVLPKKHYDNFLTIPNNELSELIKITKWLAGAVKRGVQATGFNVLSNNGISAGQSIFHFHFHIIPRFDHDNKFKILTENYNSQSLMEDYKNKIIEVAKKYEEFLNE